MRAVVPIFLLLPLCVGCARGYRDPLSPPEPAIVWPKPPDQPRIRYLGELTSSADVARAATGLQLWRQVAYGPEQPSRLITPYAVSVHEDGNRVAIADTNCPCVHVFDLARRTYKRYYKFASVGDGLDVIPEASESLACPIGVAWVGDALWVADAKLPGVVIYDEEGGGWLIDRGPLQRPSGLAYSRQSGLCYVTDAGAHCVFAYNSEGELAFEFGSRGADVGRFNFPAQIACGPDGTLAVVDALNFRVQLFDADGNPAGAFGRKGNAGGDFSLPKGVAFDADGNVWVVDAQFENVQGFDTDGRLLMAFGSEGRGVGEFWLPAGICIDARNRMWIADTYNRRVQVFELLP